MWRKQTMEKDKKTVKAEKSVHGHTPKKTKRQKVPNVPYSPPLRAIKKTTSNKKTKNNTNKTKASDAYNAKTQQLTTVLSSSSENSSNEDRSEKYDNHEENNTAVVAHDLTQQQSTAQSHESTESTRNLTIAKLLRQFEEQKEINAHLRKSLKEKEASTATSSSGIELLENTDKENIHAEFENRASVSTDSMKKQSRDVIAYEQIKQNKADSLFTVAKSISQKKSCKDQYTYSNIPQYNLIESHSHTHIQNEAELEQESNAIHDLEELDTPRQLHQLYGEDFNEDGETMILLGNNIFCKSSVLHYALGSSTKTTHFVRKLVCGVFKEEIFKKGPSQVTLTGYAPRNIGKQAEVKYTNIDVVARSTIIKYAKVIGKFKKWPYIRTKDLERTLSQKIGKLKRETNIKNIK